MQSKIIIKSITWLFVGLLFVGNTVSAQDSASIPAGPFDITPTLRVSYEDNDNFFGSTTNEQDTTTTIVMPALSVVADRGVTQYEFTYQIEDGRHSGLNDNFDYTDQQFGAEVDWQMNIRNRIALGWSLSEGHNDPSIDNTQQQNEFDDTDLSFRYIFGADGARGRIALGVTKSDLEYTNNPVITADLENEQLTTDLSLSVRVGGGSQLEFQLINDDVSFDTDVASLRSDRESLSYLLGFSWDISGQTQGSVFWGQFDTDLDSGGSSTDSTWSASVVWSPRDYTSFTLEASRATENDENGIGSFSQASNIDVSWRYDWNNRISSTLSWLRAEDDFRDAGSRVDDTDTIALALSYAIKRWLYLDFSFETTERASTVNSNINDFERDVSRLTLNMSL